jgi:hypothetical protein
MGLTELKNLEVQTIRRFAEGELDARDFTAFVQSYNSLARIIAAVDLEMRVAALETQATHAKSVSSSTDVRLTSAIGGSDPGSIGAPELVHTHCSVTSHGPQDEDSQKESDVKNTNDDSNEGKEL